ncbi:MAG: amidohydrolase family protein [Gemmatimonadetes bacterium]|nr:amidohydrolase family protein [Gemmatimonadota bacterium]
MRTGSKGLSLRDRPFRLVSAALLLVGTALVPDRGTAQVVAIVNGEVHPVSGPVIRNGTVIITDGRITAVGDNPTVPEGAQVIDAAGMVVTPGFMDPLTPTGLVEINAASGTSDNVASDERITAAFRVADAINYASTVIPVTRAEGLTSVGVAPSPGASIVGGQALVMDLGPGPTPDMVRRDPAAMIVVLGEQGSARSGGSRANAAARLREIVSDARDYQANRAAYRSGDRREYSLSHLDLEALGPVVDGEIPVVAYANRSSDIQAAIRIADELDLELVIAGAAEGWLVASDLAAAGVPVVIDPLRNLPTFDGLAATLENAGRLEEAGVEVIFSTFDAHNARNIKQSAGNAVSYGMSHEGALRAVTLGPAELLGVSRIQGSLEVGKIGDVVVWSGDPFQLSTQVRRLFIRGQETSLETRQKELFRRYRDIGDVPPFRSGNR